MSFYGNIYADPNLKFVLTSVDDGNNKQITYKLQLKTPNGTAVAETNIVLPTDTILEDVKLVTDENGQLFLELYKNDLDHQSAENRRSTERIDLKEQITSYALGTGAVVEDKISADAVTTNKIKEGAVTTEKIADQNITTEKINDSAVAWAKLNDEVKTKIATYKYNSDSCILSLTNIEEASE